jgi:hypothetical protein
MKISILLSLLFPATLAAAIAAANAQTSPPGRSATHPSSLKVASDDNNSDNPGGHASNENGSTGNRATASMSTDPAKAADIEMRATELQDRQASAESGKGTAAQHKSRHSSKSAASKKGSKSAE